MVLQLPYQIYEKILCPSTTEQAAQHPFFFRLQRRQPKMLSNNIFQFVLDYIGTLNNDLSSQISADEESVCGPQDCSAKDIDNLL